MSITRYASNTGESLTWYSSQPVADRDGEDWVYRFRAWCQREVVYSLVPVSNTPITDAAFFGVDTTGITTAGLELKGVSITANPSPEMVDVEFSFRYADFGGEIEQRAETTVREVPTRLAYEGDVPDLVEAARLAADADQDTIAVPGLKYYRSSFSSSFGWTEADLIAVSGISIAEVGAPTGIGTPTANKWILQGKSIEYLGSDTVKVSEEWEYSPIDWN